MGYKSFMSALGYAHAYDGYWQHLVPGYAITVEALSDAAFYPSVSPSVSVPRPSSKRVRFRIIVTLEH